MADPMSTARILLSQATNTYPDIVQRMVRRYLFKQDRLKTDRLESGRYIEAIISYHIISEIYSAPTAKRT